MIFHNGRLSLGGSSSEVMIRMLVLPAFAGVLHSHNMDMRLDRKDTG